MGEGEIDQTLCFWTDADPKEVRDIAQKASLDLSFYATQENPHGAITLAMGGDRLKQLQQRGVIPKNRTLESSRGRVFRAENSLMMVTFDTSLKAIRADTISQIVWDTRLATRYVKTGSLKPFVGKYEWKDDLSDFIEEVKAKAAVSPDGKVDVAFDTETMGLVPFFRDKHIVTVQFSHTEGFSTCVLCRGMSENALWQLKMQVKWLLNSPLIKLKGANLKFDLLWLAVDWGVECTNFTMDTTIVGCLLDENRSNSLKWHACEHTDGLGGYESEFEEKYDKAHMEVVPWKTDPCALTYAGGDSDATLRISNVFRRDLSKERHTQRLYVKIVHPAVRAFEKVERRGILVDVPRMKELRSEISKFIVEREQEMLKLVSPRLRYKYADKIKDQLDEGKAPLTPAMIKEHFFDKAVGMGLTPRMVTKKTEEPSTAKEHLTMFFDVPEAKEFVGLMEALNTARKTRSTYIDGYLEHLRPDGKFHPTCMLFKGGMFDGGADDEDSGTNTGRTAFKDPAWQTTPQHTTWAKKLNQCFPAPPGYLTWKRDFKQGELRVVACVAGEEKMIAVYTEGSEMNKLTGGDLHAVTGAQFAGNDLAEFLSWQYVEEQKSNFKKYRQYGKHGNFGMLYGISPEGFQRYAWRKGVSLTLAEATKYLDGFFSLYTGLRGYHESQRAFARKHGFVVSPLGRIRHLPLIRSPNGSARGHEERRAINAPIQSALSDLCIWSVAEIERQMGDDAGIVGMIHDSIHGYVREDKANAFISQIGDIMEGLPYRKEFEWEPPLTFPSDGAVGPTLGDMKEFVSLKMAA